MSVLPHLTRRGALLSTFSMLLIVVGGLTGIADVVRAGLFSAVLVAAALALAGLESLVMRGTTITRHLDADALEAGEAAPLRVTGRSSRLSEWCDARLADRHDFSEAPLSIPLTRTFDLVPTVTPPHRGVFTSGPAHLEIRDPFGIALSRRSLPGTQEWVVWPRTSMSEPLFALGSTDHTVASSFSAHLGEPGASTRAYVRGDDTRLIHWPASAHSGELIVRHLDPPRGQAVHLMLIGDVAEAGQDESWEALIEACASLWSTVHETGVPAELTVGSRRAYHREDGLDLLARASHCPAPLTIPHASGTCIFIHPSAGTVPPLPRNGVATAVVLGTDSRSDALRHRLRTQGWEVSEVAHAPRADSASSARTGEDAA